MIHSDLVSTGIDGFDKSIDMLRLGDSIVCQVGTISDYKKFLTPFVNRAIEDGRNIVYFKFANKKPLFDDPSDDTIDSINNESISTDLTKIKIFQLDPNIGFNYFTLKITVNSTIIKGFISCNFFLNAILFFKISFILFSIIL